MLSHAIVFLQDSSIDRNRAEVSVSMSGEKQRERNAKEKNVEKKENRNGVDEFLLMSKGNTLIIRYDEINKEFFYQILQQLSLFKNSSRYAYACWNYKQVFIFGGYNFLHKKHTNVIHKYNISKKNGKNAI